MRENIEPVLLVLLDPRDTILNSFYSWTFIREHQNKFTFKIIVEFE